MPIYEYQCEKCNLEFEDLVLSGSSEPRECPQCGSERISRLVSTFASIGTGSRGAGPSCAGCASNRCSSCGS